MIKKIVYSFIFCTFSGVVHSNGIKQFSNEEIQRKSIQELRGLQSELKNAIDVEIGSATCADDSQCKTLAVGANPCGGPESYKAYSTLDSDVAQLKALASQYKMVRKVLHEKTGTLGACIVIPEPEVHCQNQQCVTIQKPNVLVF